MIERRFVFEGTPACPSAHAASVVALADGRLMATWFAGSREGAPDVAIFGSEFADDAWSAPRGLVDTLGFSDGNSVPWVDGHCDVRLWYVTMEGRGWATCPVREIRSGDGVRTWDEPRFVREKPGWMVKNEPITHGGRIIMPMYDERDWTSFMYISADGGDTWERSAEIYVRGTGLIQPAVVPLDDGRLMAYMRSTGGHVYASSSLDESGLTWAAPIVTELPNPNSAVELIRLRTGSLLCVYNPSSSARTPLRVALSDDGGASWAVSRDLETEPGEFSYPTALQAADGVIHLLYTYQRRAIAHVRCDESWIRGA